MQQTPNANRLHIAIFGKRNVGKSSLINALTAQDIALVSDLAGTTTDPVYKAMELLPIGPVVIIDTAGLDDTGEIGELRIKKTKEVMDKTDLALLVIDGDVGDLTFESEWYEDLKGRKIPVVGVINKVDKGDVELDRIQKVINIDFVKVSAKDKVNIDELKKAIMKLAPEDFEKSTIVGDIVKPKARVIVVAPQDIQAPKGRLILPQVQIIRDLLDNDAMALVVKDSELEDVLASLKDKPDLVITDSQVFKKVNSIIPKDVPLTSFSILMARYKGDLNSLVKGARAIDTLKPGDKVLIAEACTHHPLEGDIGREKLPIWLQEKVGGKLDITVCAGSSFPEDLSEYKLILHCGACMFNRQQLMSRIKKANLEGLPITNFGIAIAHINGILDRVLSAFEEYSIK
ncbi:[FeFe] hydrogenase H-cluster maturation GTPase HydF [Clostridium tagluense]|uniref:[FeFe] hydrogenase H-cluster maturation GTPase HydF n=1 Tax=Clostridium tagluense TaxID=360422 RepID=UPI001C0AAFF6|nr:[FeFe] hydrogenase H-cluster maturation GTPase HydF [Clostridium tagluense]MBU3127532.1 [FeFe] hydrogenase H-cluster maturation GTPase HydF [Clostridium tagluense]MCB2312484.1 [FeFe] hydrogenase H-cluster maturation GTPase HydF [Clostridium tagluense]MCB2317159.1 [FeFe] hydrogenase H-cluster maturation GTPase HydF [Clostridium tagluense]MCB2322023.1 [FeFe] hydrogenase H-cluster maturation GTPase HydF [Clostridium tagluense]MCB2327032.1 [FeFe] hydrogenase H-cluster maturation GTPase HydF [Cl